MDVINIQLLSALLNKNYNHSKLSNSLKQINQACHFQFKYLKPEVILSTAKKINLRENCTKDVEGKGATDEQAINWGFGQFKVFIWVLIYLCQAHSIQLQDIGEKVLHEIMAIFPLKLPHFIRYQIRLLVSFKDSTVKPWSKDEVHMLEKLMKKYSQGDGANWRFVSFKLFCDSGCRYFRNLNHCRQKWNNHLNPHVKKGDWSIEEDIRLFELISQFGLKWSKISKCMDQKRTEHMVKNRYNRFIRVWKLDKNTSFQQIKNIIQQKIVEYYENKGMAYPRFSNEDSKKDTKEDTNPDRIKIEQGWQSEDSSLNKGQGEALKQSDYPSVQVKKENSFVQYQQFHIQQPFDMNPAAENGVIKVKVESNNGLFYPFFSPFFPAYVPLSEGSACVPQAMGSQ